MKFAAVFFWWPYRRQLKAHGYSLDRFCTMTAAFWRGLAGVPDDVRGNNPADVRVGQEFDRQQLRARW